MSGTLYVVPTPIGNLEDITMRAARILAEADFIAAEDTRVTVKLLNHLDIKKPMISYHEHNAYVRGTEILARISAGESCALCSDAGTPAISDPGQLLVQQALETGITVCPLPGACAAITALSAAGQSTGRFCFEGFLPVNRRARKARLEELKTETRTLVFYEAPHKLCTTLTDLLGAFGGERGITLCRELTKLHEEFIKTTLENAALLYENTPPKGEFVLVVQGAPLPEVQTATLEEAAEIAKELMEQGFSASAAAKQAALQTGQAKNAIYKLVQG